MAETVRNWTKVNSSRVDALDFDPLSRTLYVRFPANKSGDRVWGGYPNVTPEQYNDIINAPSIGKAFNAEIMAKPTDHPWAKMGADPVEPEEPTAA